MATLQQRLDDALEAQDKLLTGRAVRVFVDQNGERVEYAAANSAKLAQYIAGLQREIAGSSGCSGPMRVFI